MARKKAPEGSNQPIIVKKIIMEDHGGHHGGAWKVAYADFVTAMMAFFLMLWLLGATDEKQRKALADYFSPTLVQMKQDSAGSDGLFGGDAIMAKDNYPNKASQTGTRSITIPRDSTGTEDVGGDDDKSRKNKKAEQLDAKRIERQIRERLKMDPEASKMLKNVRFTDTHEGLRIDIIDEADFSMFALATDRLQPRAQRLVGEVAKIISTIENMLIIRGHTDGLPYASGRKMNNWLLSSARAEATRQELVKQGVSSSRVGRIEGVADTEPYNPENLLDDRNRRISITIKKS